MAFGLFVGLATWAALTAEWGAAVGFSVAAFGMAVAAVAWGCGRDERWAISGPLSGGPMADG